MILDLILLATFCTVLFALVVKGVFVVSDYLIKSISSTSRPKQNICLEVHRPLISVTGLDVNPLIEFNQIDYSSHNYHETRSIW